MSLDKRRSVPAYNAFDLATRHVLPQFFHDTVEHKSSVRGSAEKKVSRKESHTRTTDVADHLTKELSPVRRRIIILGSNYIL